MSIDPKGLVIPHQLAGHLLVGDHPGFRALRCDDDQVLIEQRRLRYAPLRQLGVEIVEQVVQPQPGVRRQIHALHVAEATDGDNVFLVQAGRGARAGG